MLTVVIPEEFLFLFVYIGFFFVYIGFLFVYIGL